MKIYFTCSARGEEDFGSYYAQIFKSVEECGHVHVSDYREDNDAEQIYQSDHQYKIQMFKDHLENIRLADVVLLEVSTHSLSMGYLMKKALEMGKPVIALYSKGKQPAFALGIEDDRLQVVEYNDKNIFEVVRSSLEYAKDKSDIRFNFFISPNIASYLDWIAKDRRIPRSVYLRRLIDRDMKDNKDYNNSILQSS